MGTGQAGFASPCAYAVLKVRDRLLIGDLVLDAGGELVAGRSGRAQGCGRSGSPNAPSVGEWLVAASPGLSGGAGGGWTEWRGGGWACGAGVVVASRGRGNQALRWGQLLDERFARWYSRGRTARGEVEPTV